MRGKVERDIEAFGGKTQRRCAQARQCGNRGRDPGGLDRLPIGFALFDAKWRLAAWNGALASICGYPKSLLSAGTPIEDFLRFNAERGDYGAGKPASLIRKRLAVFSRRRPAVREQRLADGRTLRISTRPCRPGHRLVTFEDVSEARLAEHRYEIASRAINEGVYDWDIASGKIYFSERVYTALGILAQGIPHACRLAGANPPGRPATLRRRRHRASQEQDRPIRVRLPISRAGRQLALGTYALVSRCATRKDAASG